MYAIVTIVYGVPLRSATTADELPEIVENAIEDEVDGFISSYRGSGDTPAAFGVALDSFDEACHHTELSKIKLAPTAAQQKKFTTLFEALESDLQTEVKKHGEPRVFFLWSSS